MKCPSSARSIATSRPPCVANCKTTLRALGAHTRNSHPSRVRDAPGISSPALLNIWAFTYLETDPFHFRMLAPRKLILASGSPRRKELLREAGIEFEAVPAAISEDRHPGEPALDYALRLAREKA